MRILVTGGSRGIGLETVKILASGGHQVISISRTKSPDKIFDNKNVTEITFDLSEPDRIPYLIEQIGPVDALINNAGILPGFEYEFYPSQKKLEVIRINLEAPVALITEFSKFMKIQGHGRIINNTSIAGQIGHPDIWYGITKAGLINATKSFSKLLGPYHVQVNAVAVSPVKTELLEKISLDRRQHFLSITTEKRFASPAEVARTIAWLTLDAPDYLNGACIDLNSASFFR